MLEAPARCGGGFPVLDFQHVAELVELCSGAGRDLQRLPVPKVVSDWRNAMSATSDVQVARGDMHVRAPAMSSRWVISPRPNDSLRTCFAVSFLPVKVLSTWAMTAWTSAEQFCGICWRIGSKYRQKLLDRCKSGLGTPLVKRHTYRMASTTPEDEYLLRQVRFDLYKCKDITHTQHEILQAC